MPARRADVFGHERLRPLLRPWAWFNTYWSLFAAMLLVIAAAFWVRASRRRDDLAERGAAVAARPARRCSAHQLVAFVAIGSWIFYNTNVVNDYLPSDVVLDRQAHFEGRTASTRTCRNRASRTCTRTWTSIRQSVASRSAVAISS